MNKDTTQSQVELLRRKLLDLSLRNRMLNYKPSKRLGLTIVDTRSEDVLRILVTEGRKMSFDGRPAPGTERTLVAFEALPGLDPVPDARSADEPGIEETFGPDDGEGGSARHGGRRAESTLKTDEDNTVLPAKLRVIHREAQVAHDEMGINTLYLTLGALEWNETDRRSFMAPLLYLPVTLQRQANGTIRLAHDGSDIGDNLPLRAKLSEFDLRLPEFDSDQPIATYFAAVNAVITGRKGWAVHSDDVSLGFFNYEKYVMYRDLGGEAWPDDTKPWLHADVAALLGGGYPTVDEPVTDETFLDDVRPLPESHEIYDADSSQTIAMIRAASKLSIVVEGPPGTGKSQTITNIIGEAVAAGKTVLFVAAKRAAVDVVKRRLDAAGLAAMCLDLHEKLTNRRAFYSEIKATLGRSLTIREDEARILHLEELRTRLTAHSRAANEPLADFGGRLTPFMAMAHLARLPEEDETDREARIPFEQIRHLAYEQVSASLSTIRAVQQRLRPIGVPCRNPFWGAQIAYVDPGLRLDLQSELRAAIDACVRATNLLRNASERLHIDVPATGEDVRILRVCAERASSAPLLDGIVLKTATWSEAQPLVRNMIARLEARLKCRERWRGMVRDSIWEADLSQALAAYEQHSTKWYRILLQEFRTAQRSLQPHLVSHEPASAESRRDILRDVATVQEAVAFATAHAADMSRLFGVQWQGIDTDPLVLERLLTWVLSLQEDVDAGNLPSGLLDFLSGERMSEEVLGKIAQAEQSAEQAIDGYHRVTQLLQFPDPAPRAEPWATLEGRLRSWQAALPDLSNYIAYSEARQLGLDRNLRAVVELADRWDRAADRLEETFLRSYFTGVLREVMHDRPPLRTFDRVEHEQAIREFQTLDDFKLTYNRAQVRLCHQRRLPRFDGAAGNLQILKTQCELTRGHKPIRWIMERAGEAVQRAKPVFMMSPLSVAMHLPPTLPPFDMVIFDEASQIKPEDALCPMIRGKQIIVVGDTRQMPPTSFFDRVIDDDDTDDEEDATDVAGSEARKLESVLSLMSAAVTGRAQRPDLRWHYRSLHPSLIQPSNELFYDNRLIVFPCARADVGGRRVGIVFHHHPETVYEAGANKRVNRQEAEMVAQAVYRHVREHPDESLMVAAMNKPQADLIYDEVSKCERTDPEPFDRYRAAHPHEQLDVKNLENVQGDERDVVYISVTYGRDQSGVLRHQFGPLLRDGGERRLNVLISRARIRCEVFTNITSDDLRADITAIGVTALKRYLRYAQTGRMDVSAPTGEPEESPFEEQVSAALRQRGYEVHPQVGCEGYRIDMAVVDPAKPGSYLIGIECDGATYHSARSARDRDKLRQRILEDRGWRLHRIWSPDWWQNSTGEIERLVAAIESARCDRNPEAAATDEPGSAVVEVLEDARHAVDLTITRPYITAPPVPAQTETELRSYLLDVVRHEGPIQRDLLIGRLRSAAGYGRAGRNVRTWLEGMIDSAVRSGHITSLGDAYTLDASTAVIPRDWSGRPDPERRFDYVPHVELAGALRNVVANAFGIGADDAIREAYRLMGFRRVTDDALARGRSVVETLLSANEMIQDEGILRLRVLDPSARAVSAAS